MRLSRRLVQNFSGALLTGSLLAFATSSCSHTPQYDLVISNGSIVDGTGAEAFTADIGIVGDEIVAIGELTKDRAHRIIDAAGLTVTPGFVDLHNHAERNIHDNPNIENFLRQGVTTILVGNCGNSPVDFPAFMTSVEETGISLNLGLLVGHNSVRAAVMGNENRFSTPDEQRRMEGLVKSAMDAGAFGISTGLIYPPGAYSDTNEVVGLAQVVADEGGIYASHIRNEFDEIFAAIDEAIHVGREADLPVHISHFKIADNTMWGDSVEALAMLEQARRDGLDVTTDQYPYTATSTGLSNVLPKWARAGSKVDFQARLDDPEARAKIKAETIDILNGARAAGDLSRITIASYDANPEFVGRTMADVTAMHGLPPTIENGAEVAMNLLYDASGSAIYHMMSEDDVQRIMLAPYTSIASDGSAVPFGQDVPHLRNYGTFPRVLGKYVREDGVLTLEAAVHKMTGMPAARIGLDRRGTLKEGHVADINIFDAATVTDVDAWSEPHQYATGFRFVIVNGVPVIDETTRTAALPGDILRRQIE